MEYRTLKPGDPDYPRRLSERMGREAPTLYARGTLSHLSRWTLAFFTADIEPGYVTRAVWDLFFPVLEYEMNAIGPWQSVNEGVFFRSALDKPWIALTLFSAKGLEREDYQTFLDERHKPPQHIFLQRPEYDRRAAEGELLLLSISPPAHARQSRDVILARNWAACNMADVVFIGGAMRISKEWASRYNRWMQRRQKTFILAKKLLGSGIPVFTVDHPDNQELLNLGITGLNPKTVHAFLASRGGKKGSAPPAPTRQALPVTNPPAAAPRKTDSPGGGPSANPRQLELFPPS